MPETTPTTANEPNPGIYNRFVMKVVYPVWVHGICHPLAWGISNEWIRRTYRTWSEGEHLSIGPGNGRFLRHLSPRTRWLHLMDLNPECTEMAREVLRRRPITVAPAYTQDVLTAWTDLADESVDSIDAMMMVHCLRGSSLEEKEVLFAEARRVLKPGGKFFGATILDRGEPVKVNRFARLLMRIYNGRTNTFCNSGDTFEDLVRVVRKYFPNADVDTQGCTGTWVAVK